MKITNAQLKVLLLGANLIAPDQFEKAEKSAKEKNTSIEIELVHQGVIKDNQLGRIIANYLKVNFVDMSSELVHREMISLIPEFVAKTQNVIPFKKDADKIHVATSNTDNYAFFQMLKKKTGQTLEIYYATPFAIQNALKVYKDSLSSNIKILLDELNENPEKEDNIVELVNLVLEFAHDSKASDIHIEPLEDEVLIRLRVDGVLHEVASYPKSLHDKIIFRIKILSKLRTDEHAAAQDGRMTYPSSSGVSSEDMDVRVSILPVTEGENVVMRLLAGTSERLFLEDLGLMPRDLEIVKNASSRTYGMILTVGPTGSGKTTTLYSILQILNRPEVNIMTIEDPVEYNVSHIQQTQVNVKKNIDFSTGLRTIVRQDPDIIMVGEIRDSETADIAVNAAMTGHLVLSTLHANNAPTAFPRLLDMGVEPFLVASSVNVIIAQRLVRTICSKCRTSYILGEDGFDAIKEEKELVEYLKKISGKDDCRKLRIYKGAGCSACDNTGYTGRQAIFEVLDVNEEIRKLIIQKASSEIIEKKVKELGMTNMMESGVYKVLEAVTTLDEVLRVIKS